MPDQWQVTEVIETTDRSGKVEAWQVTLTRASDDTSLVLFLPKTAIEDAAVTYGLSTTDEAIDVILHQTVLSIYEPEQEQANPWQASGEQARAAVVDRVERCKREYATVETDAPRGRTAAARAAGDALAPLRGHVRVDPVRIATSRLEFQRALASRGA
ncbi:hypothetical protein ACOZ38_25145 [Sphaerisporangium viridialbum]|uniref:hypothetical protein n=1 Tax=Sphaerisporangium viridialbum TaxID=46189 RepID=UPI003C7865CC